MEAISLLRSNTKRFLEFPKEITAINEFQKEFNEPGKCIWRSIIVRNVLLLFGYLFSNVPVRYDRGKTKAERLIRLVIEKLRANIDVLLAHSRVAGISLKRVVKAWMDYHQLENKTKRASYNKIIVSLRAWFFTESSTKKIWRDIFPRQAKWTRQSW